VILDEADDYDGEHVDEAPPPARRRRGRGCIPVLIGLLVLGGLAWFGGKFAYDELSSRFGPAPDYAGPGSGSVLYQVKDGDTSADIGRELKTKGVVKSVD
jgi:UPF0755 protein